MKKLNLIIILFISIFLLSSCITKSDIEKLEDDISDLEKEYEELIDNEDSINKNIETLKAEIADIENEKAEVNDEINDKLTINQDLKDEIPVPTLFFEGHQFAFHLEFVNEETGIGKNYGDKSWTNPAFEKTKNEITQETYVLKGDIDTDEYLCIMYYEHYDFGNIYGISIEYSSEKYKEEYDDLVTLAGPALIMIIETPYYYKSEYMKRGETIIEDGSYLGGLVKIVKEKTDNGEILKIYTEN